MKNYEITTGTYNTKNYKTVAGYDSIAWLEKKLKSLMCPEWIKEDVRTNNFRSASWTYFGTEYTLICNF